MSSEYGNEIRWQSGRSYSPVQDRTGIKDLSASDFPPAHERISQNVDPYAPRFLDEREIMRVTYQGDDRCQLACPGCYTGGRLRVSAKEAASRGGRKVTPWEDFTGQVEGLSPGMQDFYLIGAEATMDPAGSAAKLRYTAGRGWPQQIISHGAVSVRRFEETFGSALDSGRVYMLVISLDSMDAQVHNELRGRSFAYRRTVEVIKHCVRRGAPMKVQMTVWPRNYAGIL
ncbi:MAG: radical SAM protein, partial [Streptosporangiaceae bacterium]